MPKSSHVHSYGAGPSVLLWVPPARKGLISRSLHAAFRLRWADWIFEPHTRSRLAVCAPAGQVSNLLARDASDKWGRGETDFAGSCLGYGTTSKPAWRK